jgi:hypothetical protein
MYRYSKFNISCIKSFKLGDIASVISMKVSKKKTKIRDIKDLEDLIVKEKMVEDDMKIIHTDTIDTKGIVFKEIEIEKILPKVLNNLILLIFLLQSRRNSLI